MQRILIIGCGDIGRRLAREWQAAGGTAPLFGLVRGTASAERLRGAGIAPLQADLDQPASLGELPTAGAWVFYFAPPPERGAVDSRLRAFLASVSAERLPERVVYISTSGVYGDRAGAWVSEQDAPAPATDRARRRLDAETALRQWSAAQGVPVVILRVGGIYGPGRLPVERLRRGEPVLRPEESGYTNRIHADDLARICLAAAERGRPGGIYNVSDGRPGTMAEYFLAVAEALGLPAPPTIGMAEARDRLSPAMLSYLTESRRLDTRKLREELGVALRYPDLASSLAAIGNEPVGE